MQVRTARSLPSATKPEKEKKSRKARALTAADYLDDLRALKKPKDEDEFAFFSEDIFQHTVDEWIPTGSLAIDKLIGGGWPVGRVAEMASWEGVAKSSLIDMSIAQCQQMGGVACLIDTEAARDEKYTRALGVDVDKLIVYNAETIEESFAGIDKMLAVQEKRAAETKGKPPLLMICWDSLVGDSRVMTPQGEVELSSVRPGDWAYCVADNLTVRQVRAAQRTGRNKPIVRLRFRWWKDRSHEGEIRLTPEHKVMLCDRTYKRAADLVMGDRILSTSRILTNEKSGEKRWRLSSIALPKKWAYEHRLFAEALFGPVPVGHVVHHRNGDETDNSEDNLEVLAWAAHASGHWKTASASRKTATSEQARARLKAWWAGKTPEQRSEIGASASRLMWKKKSGDPAWHRSLSERSSRWHAQRRAARTTELRSLVLIEGLSLPKAADRMGIGLHHLKTWMRQWDISLEENHLVLDVQPSGRADTYDLVMDEDAPNFVANGIVVHNSVGGTPTTAERDGAADEAHVMEAARAIKMNLRRIALRLSKLRTTLVLTNHFYQTIGTFASLKTYGGSGIRYFCSVRVWLTKKEQIKVGQRPVGHVVEAKLKKTRVGLPAPPVELGLIWGGGIDNSYTLFEWGLANGVSPEHRWVAQRGAWYYLMLPDGTHEVFQNGFLGLGEIFRNRMDVYGQMVEGYMGAAR